jgi:hypothetical protein
MMFLMQSSDKEKEKTKRLISLWRENKVFNAELMNLIESLYFDGNAAISVQTTSVETPSAQSTSAAPAQKPVAEKPDRSSPVSTPLVPSTQRLPHPPTPSTQPTQRQQPTPLTRPVNPYPASTFTPTSIGVGSLLSSMINGTTTLTSPVPTMDQLNTLLNIPAPVAPPSRDPAQFDYEDEDDVFVSRRTSVGVSVERRYVRVDLVILGRVLRYLMG